jgi:hypothetical protein
MLATLSQRNFALLWLAGLISTTGDWVLTVGLPIYAYLLTRSVLALKAYPKNLLKHETGALHYPGYHR